MTTSTFSGPFSGRVSPPESSPRWVRPGLLAVLLLAAALYGWGLSGSGYANEYYSAAVKSGTESWKAFFFGSLDSASFITVDKPPMALWVQELSARIFGFGTWSLLVPSVLMGVATVGVLYATVRRAFGPVAGLIAALVMTLTPITVAINRDNNPDTLLVLLLVLSVWALQRALTSGRLPWLMASAFFLGCAFNTKMLQAYLVLPALVLVFAAFAPGGLLRRVVHLLAAGAVLAVSSLWWMVVVDLIPASQRPYIGGSTDNTVWDLVIGYNGLGRVMGGSGGPGSGGPGSGFGGRGGQGASFAGASGPGRLFNAIVGGQISWLLPVAAFALVTGVILLWRRPRTDVARSALALWGGWLVVHFVVFSFSSGTMHPYYTTALTPAVAALTGIGGVLLYEAHHRSRAWSLALPLGIASTGAWSFGLLRRTPEWHPWLTWTVAALTVVATAALVTVWLTSAPGSRARHSPIPIDFEVADEGTPDDTRETTSPTTADTEAATSQATRPEPASSDAVPLSALHSETVTPTNAPLSAVPPNAPETVTLTNAPSRAEPLNPAGSETVTPRNAPPRAVPPNAADSDAVTPRNAPSRAVSSGVESSAVRRLTVLAVIVGILAALTGPAAYAASAATSHTNGTNPLAGPASGGFGMGGPGMPGGARPPADVRRMMEEGRFSGGRPPFGNPPSNLPSGSGEPADPNQSNGSNGPGATGPGTAQEDAIGSGTAGSGTTGEGPTGTGSTRPGNTRSGATGSGAAGTGTSGSASPGSGSADSVTAEPESGEAGQSGQPSGTGGPPGTGSGQRTGPPGGGGGPGMGQVDSQLISYLQKHRDGATWLVAVASAQSASSIILRTGLPVIAMGGFTGSDPAMTTQKLQSYVQAGKLHYVMTGGGGPGGGPGGGGTSSVTSWVSQNCSVVKASDYDSSSTSAQNSQTLYRCG